MHLQLKLMRNSCRGVLSERTLGRALIEILACIVAILVISSSHAGAQLVLSFTPMLVELTAAQGAVQTFEVIVINESKIDSANFRIYVADIKQKPNGDYEVVESGTSDYSCAKWISLSADKATIGPSDALVVRGKVAVPRGVSGGRYAAVVFESIPDERKAESAFASTTFVQRLVTVVELSIPARQVSRNLSVTGFSVSHVGENAAYARMYGKSAVIIAAEIRNEGGIHVFVRGSMILRDATGKRLREIPLGAGRGVVLPGAAINLSSILPGGLAPGDYIADVSVKYGGMRPATAKVPFSVGEGETEVAKTETAAVIAPFSVDPEQLDLSYPGGAIAARTLVIENRSDQIIRVEGRAVPLAFDEEGELILEDVPSSAASCADWIELRPNVVEIKPRARQVVRMMISIPKETAGGKYANVVFTGTPVSSDGSTAMGSGESGIVVFLRVGKDFETVGELSPITVIDGGPSVGTVFGTVFKNTGTIHATPRASMTIKKRIMPESVPGIEYVGPGSLVDVNSLDLGAEENVVLPGGLRAFDVALSGRLEPGDYVVEFLVSYGGKAPLYVCREFTVE